MGSAQSVAQHLGLRAQRALGSLLRTGDAIGSTAPLPSVIPLNVPKGRLEHSRQRPNARSPSAAPLHPQPDPGKDVAGKDATNQRHGNFWSELSPHLITVNADRATHKSVPQVLLLAELLVQKHRGLTLLLQHTGPPALPALLHSTAARSYFPKAPNTLCHLCLVRS